MLGKSELAHVLTIMQSIKIQILDNNWDEVNRLDAERRQIICKLSASSRVTLNNECSSVSPENINKYNGCSTADLDTHTITKDQEREDLINIIKALDEEILEACLSARTELLETTRKFSSQQKVKSVYAKTSNQI